MSSNGSKAFNHRQRLVRGFSLIELTVTIAILAILLGLAAPSFLSTIERYRVDNTREGFVGSFNLARGEAIRQGQSVTMQTLCTIPAPPASANNWSCGWRVFSDINSDNSLNAGELVIQEVPVNAAISVMSTNTSTSSLRVDRFGRPVSSFGFQIYPTAKSSTDGVTVCGSSAGRVRTASGGSC